MSRAGFRPVACDIHAFLEFRSPPDGAWSACVPQGLHGQFYDPKDYEDHSTNEFLEAHYSIRFARVYPAFASLAGVRQAAQPIAFIEPRASWLTRDELISANERIVATGGEIIEAVGDGARVFIDGTLIGEIKGVIRHERILNEDIERIVFAMSALEERGYETRLVFWFDN